MTTDNMRVINEEYDRMVNADNLIMSEGLMERMSTFSQESLPAGADSHDLYVSFTEGVMDVAHISGALHTLRQSSKEDITISFEVSNITQEILRKFYSALSSDMAINVKISGAGGFSCNNAKVSHWDLMKVAPHQFLFSITFGGSDVVF